MNDDKKHEIERDKVRTTVALANSEVVGRFGSANAEYVKGYTGMDNETGQTLRKGLKAISQEKTGLPQKAGTSAEILATSRDNAESIINKSSQKSARTDDHSKKYGTNHPVADRVKTGADGSVSYSQMKFEADPKKLVDNIVRKDGDYAKYLDPVAVCEERAAKHFKSAELADAKAQGYEASGNLDSASQWRQISADLRARAEANLDIAASEIKIEVPSEQVDYIKKHCQERASSCLGDASKYELDALHQESSGNLEAAAALRKKAGELRDEAERCKRLESQVVDSGVSQGEANLAARQPFKVTATNILKTSHRAGIEGAKFGAAIGGAISLLTNIFAAAQSKKQLDEAAKDVAIDTAKAAAVGYGTAATGSAIKGVMQQSSNAGLRTLSQTAAPVIALNVCLSLGSSVKRYVNGEISEGQFLSEVGEKGAGMLSSSMMAALGQVAIPIPVVGAVIGSMIGYSLSSFFYQSALEAALDVERSRQDLERIRAIQEAARMRISDEQAVLDELIRTEIPALKQETEVLFSVTRQSLKGGDINAVAEAINSYATLLGKNMQFKSMEEFEGFMASNEPLRF